MAFEKFQPQTKVAASGNKAERVSATREPWGVIDRNGVSNYIMHFSRSATLAYGFKEGDRLDLTFDPETHRIGVKMNPKGTFVLSGHGKGAGEEATRFKVSITSLYREKLERYNLDLPFKSTLAAGEKGERMTFVVPLPKPRRKPRTVEAVTPEPVTKTRKPRSDAGVKRGPYKTTSTPEPVVTAPVRKTRKKETATA